MTAQLSRERIEEIANFESDLANKSFIYEDARRMACMLLAGMESKPVAYIGKQMLESLCDEGGRTCGRVWRSDTDELSGESRIPLYAAPPAPVMPGELHPDTQKLVADFCAALAEKLYKAQLKYGYDADWKQDGWPSQCQAHFHQHIAKGDPRDVAAYCAFMWYHGWKTEAAKPALADVPTFEEWCQRTNQKPVGWVREAMKESYDGCRAAMLKAGPVTAVAVPERWKLVPVDPTDAMCDIKHVGVDVCTGLAEGQEYYSICGEDARRVYRAMLAAAPEQGV